MMMTFNDCCKNFHQQFNGMEKYELDINFHFNSFLFICKSGLYFLNRECYIYIKIYRTYLFGMQIMFFKFASDNIINIFF